MIASIYLIGIAQGLLLSLNFYFRGKADGAFYWLCSLIFATTLMIAGQWLLVQQWHIYLWPLFLVSTGLIFVSGPTLYFFIRRKVYNQRMRWGKIIPHYIPACLYLLLIWYAAFPYTAEHLYGFITGSTAPTADGGIPLLPSLKLLHILIYTVASFRLVWRKQDTMDLKSLWYFIFWYIIIQAIAWMLLLTSVFVQANFLQLADHIVAAIMCLYVYSLGYMSMRKSDFLKGASLVTGKKYQTAGLDSETSQKCYQALLQLMDRESPYLNPDLTLNALADQATLKPHYLSQVINENAGTNFSDFVNRYRVEKVKEYMGGTRFQHYTLLAIAFEAGFNNKNSFNVAFKKHTGQTPTAYRKSLAVSSD